MLNKEMYRSFILLLCCGMAVGCTQTSVTSVASAKPVTKPVATNGDFFIEVPHKDKVRFIGQVNFDDLHGPQANILYPGNDIGTFLVGIAAHAITSGAVQKSRKKNIVNEANEVLAPYSAIIDKLNYQRLLDLALIELNVNSNPFSAYTAQDVLENNWLVKLNPIYVMSENEKTITIESTVSILLASDRDKLSEKSIYEKSIKVSSNPVANPGEWLKNDGVPFQDTTSDLLARTVQLAIKDFVGGLPTNVNETETIRYLDNGEKKVERGRLIEKSCDSVLFETLRKGLKLVPRFNKGNCKPIESVGA